MDQLKNQLLKQKVIEHAKNPSFRHHKWFVKYHLEVDEQIAHELCQLYPEADKQYVDVLVWLHDYEKIFDLDNQYNTGLRATRELMQEIGYSQGIITEMCNDINRYNAKTDLQSAKIEIQIVSSADAASHLVGPFISLFWYENSTKSISWLQEDTMKKFSSEWEMKITIPEVKRAFADRYQVALEIAGKLPKLFLN